MTASSPTSARSNQYYLRTYDFALVVPMANEEADFHPFVDAIRQVLDHLASGKVYFIVDKVSKDSTLELCRSLSSEDPRFVTV